MSVFTSPECELRVFTNIRQMEKIRVSTQIILEDAIFGDQGSPAERRLLLVERVQKMYEQGIAREIKGLGEAHPITINSMGFLAELLDRSENYSEAERLYNRIYSVQLAAEGPNNRDVLLASRKLAQLFSHQNDLEEAERLYQNVLSEQERTFGPEDRDTLETMEEVAVLRIRQGRLTEALEIYQKLLSVLVRVKGDYSRAVHIELQTAGILVSQDYLDEAEECYNSILGLPEEVLGPQHLALTTSRSNLANIQSLRADFGKGKNASTPRVFPQSIIDEIQEGARELRDDGQKGVYRLRPRAVDIELQQTNDYPESGLLSSPLSGPSKPAALLSYLERNHTDSKMTYLASMSQSIVDTLAPPIKSLQSVTPPTTTLQLTEAQIITAAVVGTIASGTAISNAATSIASTRQGKAKLAIEQQVERDRREDRERARLKELEGPEHTTGPTQNISNGGHTDGEGVKPDETSGRTHTTGTEPKQSQPAPPGSSSSSKQADNQKNAKSPSHIKNELPRTTTAPSNSRQSPSSPSKSSESPQELARKLQQVQKLHESRKQEKQQKLNETAKNIEQVKASIAKDVGPEASNDLDRRLRAHRANHEDGESSGTNGRNGTSQPSAPEEEAKEEAQRGPEEHELEDLSPPSDEEDHGSIHKGTTRPSITEEQAKMETQHPLGDHELDDLDPLSEEEDYGGADSSIRANIPLGKVLAARPVSERQDEDVPNETSRKWRPGDTVGDGSEVGDGEAGKDSQDVDPPLVSGIEIEDMLAVEESKREDRLRLPPSGNEETGKAEIQSGEATSKDVHEVLQPNDASISSPEPEELKDKDD